MLFQGDSITDGNRGRSADPNHILGHGYAFIIAARHGAAFPERKLDFANRGVSGNTVLDLEKRWPKDTLALKPDLLSVMIGVNDQSRNVTLEAYEATYDDALTYLDSLATSNNIDDLSLYGPYLSQTQAQNWLTDGYVKGPVTSPPGRNPGRNYVQYYDEANFLLLGVPAVID